MTSYGTLYDRPRYNRHIDILWFQPKTLYQHYISGFTFQADTFQIHWFEEYQVERLRANKTRSGYAVFWYLLFQFGYSMISAEDIQWFQFGCSMISAEGILWIHFRYSMVLAEGSQLFQLGCSMISVWMFYDFSSDVQWFQLRVFNFFRSKPQNITVPSACQYQAIASINTTPADNEQASLLRNGLAQNGIGHEKRRPQQSSSGPSLSWILFRTFWKEFLLSQIWKVFSDILAMCSPLILGSVEMCAV